MQSETQEYIDAFYFKNGPCCAGCDWWHHSDSKTGECRNSPPVDGEQRWALLGIKNISGKPLPPGHILTAREHVCGAFKDDFDWESLPLPYRKRIGQL